MKYGKPNEITNCAGGREIEMEWDCCHSSQVLHQTHLVFFPFRHSNRHTTETLWHFVSWKYSLVCIVWLHMYCLLVARFFRVISAINTRSILQIACLECEIVSSHHHTKKESERDSERKKELYDMKVHANNKHLIIMMMWR